MAVLTAGLMSGGAGALMATTPAQAALGNCPVVGAPHFCLYTGSTWNGTFQSYPGDVPRNVCIVVSFPYNSVWNATSTRWFLFRTTTCNGSHAEIAPGTAGGLPTGYGGGQTRAIMRTSSTS